MASGLHMHISTHIFMNTYVHTTPMQNKAKQLLSWTAERIGARVTSRWWREGGWASPGAQALLMCRWKVLPHLSQGGFLAAYTLQCIFFQRCKCRFIKGQLFRATPVSAVSQNNKLKICQRSLFWGGTFWSPTVIFLGGISCAPAVSAAVVKGRWHWVLMSKKYQVIGQVLPLCLSPISLVGSGLHIFSFMSCIIILQDRFLSSVRLVTETTYWTWAIRKALCSKGASIVLLTLMFLF